MFLEYTQSCKTDWLHWEILYFLRNCFISKLSKLKAWAWLTKCWLTEREDLSLDPNTHVEGWTETCVWVLGFKLR